MLILQEQEKVVKSIEVFDNDGNISILEIEFTDGKKAFMVAEKTSTMRFLNQKVLVTFKQDVMKGKLVDFIHGLTIPQTIVTLEKKENIKLFIEDIPDTAANVMFKDLVDGDLKLNQIVYCDRVEEGASPKATWVEFRILDKKRNIAKLKVFNPERQDYSKFIGKYLVCDLRKTKFGFNTQEVHVKENLTISANPEIELAKRYILNTIAEDEALAAAVEKINLLHFMSVYNEEGDLETGYLIVKTAMEVSLASEFRNLSQHIDFNLMRRAFILNKLFVLTDNEEETRSKELQCILKVGATGIPLTKKLLSLIESNSKKVLLEREMMNNISSMVKKLLENTKAQGLLLLNTDKVWK